jgi:nucleoside 2-deoxyribosyltransferase
VSRREVHELRTDEIAQADRVLAIVQFFERLQEDLSTAVVQLIDRGTIDDHMGQVTELKIAAFGIFWEIDALLASFQIDADRIQETLAKVLGVEVDHRGFETEDFHMRNFVDLNRETQ